MSVCLIRPCEPIPWLGLAYFFFLPGILKVPVGAIESMGMDAFVTNAAGAAVIGPPTVVREAAGPILVPGFALISLSGTGIVIVALAASKVAWTMPFSSHTVTLFAVASGAQSPRSRKGCMPGSRGGGHWPDVGSQAPRE